MTANGGRTVSEIVIVGGGHVGITLLADLEMTRPLHGYGTRLLFVGDDRDSLSDRMRDLRGTVRLTNVMEEREDLIRFAESCFGMLNDPSSILTLAAASVIVIAVPDIPLVRLRLIRLLLSRVPLAGKTLVFVRGGQGGQPVIAELVRTTPELADTSVVLVEDSFYGTRVSAGEIAFKRKLSVNVSVYSKDVDEALNVVRSMFPLGELIGRSSWPEIVPRRGIDLLFDPLGYIIHVGVALHAPNVDRTSRGVAYTHYIEGIDEELAQSLDLLDRERVRLAAAYGVEAELFPEIIERQYGLPQQDDFFAMMQSCRGIYRSMSSGSLEELRQSRHILEDMPALCTVEWLAGCAGVELPSTVAYARQVRRTMSELGIDESPSRAYLPFLDGVDSDVGHIRSLLTDPHALALLPFPHSTLTRTP